MTSQCSQCEMRPARFNGLCSACYQRTRYHEKKAGTYVPAARTCARCGSTFTPKTHAAKTTYCSVQCKEAARTQRPSKARGNDGSCLECGKSLTGLRADARFCSPKCRHLRHVGPGARPTQAVDNDGACRCGKSLEGKRPNVRWCSNRCHNLWKLYGITAPEVDALMARQGGGCAICGTTEWGNGGTPSVDHCHNSLRVRGILCARCNGALGLLDDDVDRLQAAAEYLKRDAAMT